MLNVFYALICQNFCLSNIKDKSCCTLWHVFSLRIWKLPLSFSIWLKIFRDEIFEISLYVQRIGAEIEYHMPYVQQLSFYVFDKQIKDS